MEWKKLLYYIPGVGLANHAIKEYKTRRGKRPVYDLKESHDRRALGVYAIEVGYFALALSWKVYVGNGIATKEWNPLNQIKNYTEKRERNIERKERNMGEQNTLEKTINYDKILK
jgi:hypothetical protein